MPIEKRQNTAFWKVRFIKYRLENASNCLGLFKTTTGDKSPGLSWLYINTGGVHYLTCKIRLAHVTLSM